MRTGKLEVLETTTTYRVPLTPEDAEAIDQIEGMGQHELNLRGVENTREYDRLNRLIENELPAVDVESDGYYWMNEGVVYAVKEQDDTEELHDRIRDIIEEFLVEVVEIMARDPNFVSEEVESALEKLKSKAYPW